MNEPAPVSEAEVEAADVQAFRSPILLSEHAVAVINIFVKPTDYLADLWAWDFCLSGQQPHKTAALQFIAQLENHWCPAFMIELRKAITEKLREHDKECGTKFADES